MRIKKVSQVAGLIGGVSNVASESTTDAYSCDYINELNTYSETEKVVGTWINGKPLYRKVIYKTSLSSGDNIYSIGDSTMRIVKLEGIMYQSSNGVVFMLPDVNSSHIVQTEIYITENYTLHINTRRDVSAVNYVAISVYYYKTTD